MPKGQVVKLMGVCFPRWPGQYQPHIDESNANSRFLFNLVTSRILAEKKNEDPRLGFEVGQFVMDGQFFISRCDNLF